MKSSTEVAIAEVREALEQVALPEQEWQQLLTMLPVDLEATARASKALLRQRQVKSAADLLRLVLAYSVWDWSLRLVGVWGVLLGLGELSDKAVRKRLRQACEWLGELIGALLAQRRVLLAGQPGVRVRIVDATVVNGPGKPSIHWRVHLSLDLARLCLDGIEVTDASGGESLARFPSQPGEIHLGDRGYAYASSLGPALAAATRLVVRMNCQNLRLEDALQQRWDPVTWLKDNFKEGVSAVRETQVWLPTPQGRFPLRLVAQSLPTEAAERARNRVRKKARKRGRTPDAVNLFTAGFVLLLTNLPVQDWPATQVLALYRLRWQIELHIKRLKSLLQLDHLRAKDTRLAQAYLLGKLLAALLVDDLTYQTTHRVAHWFSNPQRPVSAWRLTALCWDYFRTTLRGHISLERILALLPKLERFLCDAPRKRRQQLACARSLFAALASGERTPL